MRRRQGPGGAMVHVELHTDDGDAAIELLRCLVGWPPRDIHHGTRSYRYLDLGNRIGGGVVQCGVRPAQWIPYATVDDVLVSTLQAQDLGATVMVAPRQGAQGWRSVVATPASGVIGLWQPQTSVAARRRG
jgi:predicted enzyme related to lactoylglutathione lyase